MTIFIYKTKEISSFVKKLFWFNILIGIFALIAGYLTSHEDYQKLNVVYAFYFCVVALVILDVLILSIKSYKDKLKFNVFLFSFTFFLLDNLILFLAYYLMRKIIITSEYDFIAYIIWLVLPILYPIYYIKKMKKREKL